jgi:bifunctional UDP-N-acetylglucosamine pyrophosphorylase/glucosamine-1-phosphate N-acetyltransferase
MAVAGEAIQSGVGRQKTRTIVIKGRPETPTHAANAAYFGDFCRTGVNAIIMPGRRIGVYSVVGPGVLLYDDLPDRTMVTAKQELVTRPWGPERYGW